MSFTQTLIRTLTRNNSRRPRIGTIVPPGGQHYVRDYPSAGLTPSRLMAILQEADDGSLSTAMQLFEEMEEKDAHLFSIANMRRLAVAGLDWDVVSAADVRTGVDRARADQAADYCRDVLAEMDSFDDGLQHLSLAVGRNLAVAEIEWRMSRGELRPVNILPIEFSRIGFDENNRLRILTADQPRDGIEITPNKFIIHAPHSVSGYPQRGGLLRVTAMIYLAKNLALKDWMIFSEVFGMPVRIARYEPTATAEEKREMLNMLESLGSNAAGIFSRAVELQVIEANRGTIGPPYERFIEFVNREMSKAWLGQTLTTDVSGQKGTLAASQVHEQVRQDVLADDLRKECRTIRRDLLGPMVRFKFGDDAVVPYFRRKVKQKMQPGQLAELLDTAINQLGVNVPEGWAHDALGIPRGAQDEPALTGLRN